MEFRILGPTEVLDNGEPLPLPKGRARSLLGLLVLRVGEVVSSDRLIDELWGEAPPPTVGTALQGLVSSLRKRLEPYRDRAESPTVLVTRGSGYLLAADPGEVDANRFRRLIVEAAQTHPLHAAELLRAALGLWRGPALADFTYEPFAQVEIAELEELRLTAMEKRVEADLAIGRHREVVGELERLVAEHPLREGVRRLLMLALYRSGRQAEALQVYADIRRTLVEELGLDPAPFLQQLEELILRQDRSLDLEAVSPSSPSAPSRWIADERKMVTVLSVDVVASLGEGEAPDAEVSRRALEKFFHKAAAVVIGHGGQAEVVIRDALVGTFGVPTAREDDALRAVRSAVDLRHLLAAYNAELGQSGHVRLIARTGIDTGEAVINSTANDPAGGPVRGATLLHQSAGAGEILVGETTRLLIGKGVLVEPLEINRRSPHRSLWRVLDLVSGVPALALSPETAMVGREIELSQLTAAFRRVARAGRPFRLVMLGDPGVGKSRLARELAEVIGTEASVVTGHCLSYGEGVAFWPVREILVSLAGQIEASPLIDLMGDEKDAEAIARLLVDAFGPGQVESPGSLFPVFGRFFEALACRRPVVLILEDLHWAQPTFLDLVDYLTETAQSPLLLLCLARPELLEVHPSFGEGVRAGTLRLGPLGPGESRKLAANRLAGRMVPTEVLTRILESAQGNPLFVEQLLAAIEEEGEFVIPATLQALLAARIDRLGPAERDLIRFASVLGSRFRVAALLSLLPELARPYALSHIRTLERKDLMHLLADSPEEERLGFRHVLIQQAAYRSMTMKTRALLHERAGAWLEAEAGQDRDQIEEAVGYHLERAYEYRLRLGEMDEHARGLAIRAGEKLAGAGLRAFSRFDAASAENLLRRSRSLLPLGHPAHSDVSFRL
ncbi:MAG TPA: BTAD domain-containing putative transcriptional regulator, partial [Acidimicrobiia bacterium]